MCYHYSMFRKAAALAKRYNRSLENQETDFWGERYHIPAFTCPLAPVITEDPEIQMYYWGLIPSWTKTKAEAEKIRHRTFNARAESIFEKPSYRNAIKSQRCLVPTTGFFDWKHENGKKVPYFIYLKDEDIFSMAGIYEEWKDPETKQKIRTFSIITTEANSLMKDIHNTNFRMPVILLKEDEEKWTYPVLRKKDIENLLLPLEELPLEAYIVKNNFLKKAGDDPSILQPALQS